MQATYPFMSELGDTGMSGPSALASDTTEVEAAAGMGVCIAVGESPFTEGWYGATAVRSGAWRGESRSCCRSAKSRSSVVQVRKMTTVLMLS